MVNYQGLSQYHQINQVRMHYKTAGPEDGEPVLLLHGFPEFWYGWRSQIPALADAGFRVVAPDQRGYNLTEKPKGIRQYDIDLLARDMIGLMDHLGFERAHVAGHDWGAAVAWWMAMHHPERVKQLAILNVPHPYVMLQNVLHNRAQRRKSWYIFFFQLPWLPELALSRRGHGTGVRVLKRSSLPGSFTGEDLARYRAAWSNPHTWSGMINWYRAIRHRVMRGIPPTKVQAPTLIIWGKKDLALEAEMAEQSLEYCHQAQLKFIPEATHWVQHDAADQVNSWLVEFFRQESGIIIESGV